MRRYLLAMAFVAGPLNVCAESLRIQFIPPTYIHAPLPTETQELVETCLRAAFTVQGGIEVTPKDPHYQLSVHARSVAADRVAVSATVHERISDGLYLHLVRSASPQQHGVIEVTLAKSSAFVGHELWVGPTQALPVLCNRLASEISGYWTLRHLTYPRAPYAPYSPPPTIFNHPAR